MNKVLTVLVFSLACVVMPMHVDASSSEELATALRATYAQWQVDSTFMGSFRWGRIAFDSVADAKNDGWNWTNAPIDTPLERGGFATGRIVKMGSNLRIIYEPRQEPIWDSAFVPPTEFERTSGAGRHISNLGYDEITDGRFHLRRYAELTRKHLEDDLIILPIDAPGEPPIPPYCTQQSIGLLTPLRPLTTLSSDPFNQGESNPLIQVSQKRDVTEVADGRYKVTLTADYKNPDYRSVCKLVFQKSPPHRLEGFANEATFPDGKLMARFEVELSDFVPLAEGDVARRIRHIPFNRSGGIVQQEFYSADLGNVPPTIEDFRYQIPRGIRIGGLKSPEMIANKGSVLLSDLRDDNFVDVIDHSVNRQQGEEAHPNHIWSIAAVIGIVMAILLTAFVRKKSS